MKVTTLIPTKRNDGTPVSNAEMNEITDEIWSQFGGLTIEGTTRGVWVDGDDVYDDECLKVVIDCDNSRYSEVENLVRKIGKRLDQKAMWLEVQYFDGTRILPID